MEGRWFSTTAIIAVFFALYDAQHLTQLGQSFVGEFGRHPVEPRHVFYATTEPECFDGVQGLLASSIRPGLIGIAGQVVKYPDSWENYDHQIRMYQVAMPQKKGPFLRVLSACNMDGYCVVFDMYGLAKSEGNSVATIPYPLVQLLSENTIVCHAAGNDKAALYYSFGMPRQNFKHFIDPQRMWNKDQDIKLDTIVMELFGVTMSKEEQYDPLYWHNDGHQLQTKKITYAAKGAMAALDNFVGMMIQNGNDIHTCELNAGPAVAAAVHTEDSHTSTVMQPFPQLDQPFENAFGRVPVEPKEVFYATTEQECIYGVQRLLSSSIHPGVIGIDGEFITYQSNWKDADHRLRRYQVAKPQSIGPFLRALSACNMDGYCVVFDMYGLATSEENSVATIPDSLMFLLSQNTIVCHGAGNDILALRNSFGIPRETFNHFIDPQKMWNRPTSVGLDTIVKTMFGVELSKEEQGRGLDWHNCGFPLPDSKIAYSAKDAMAPLDYYMGLKMLNVDDILTDQMGEHSAEPSTGNRRRRPRRRRPGD